MSGRNLACGVGSESTRNLASANKKGETDLLSVSPCHPYEGVISITAVRVNSAGVSLPPHNPHEARKEVTQNKPGTTGTSLVDARRLPLANGLLPVAA